MTVQHECELILAVADAEKLQQSAHARIWAELPLRFQSNTRLTDWYWDTPDYALTRAGWAIRLRVAGKDAQLQAKSLHPSDAAGVNLREEFHQRARVNFNGMLSTLEVGPVSMLIAEQLGKPVLDIELTPLFAITRMRKTYKIMANPLAYLMLDSGAIHQPGVLVPEMGGSVKSFYRSEIEGDPAAREQLLAWAHGLVAEMGAEITPISKFEMAWQALNLPEEVLALGHAAASRHPLAVDQALPTRPPLAVEAAVPVVPAGATPTATRVKTPMAAANAGDESSGRAARHRQAQDARPVPRLEGSAAAAIAAEMAARQAAEAGNETTVQRSRASSQASSRAPSRLASHQQPQPSARPPSREAARLGPTKLAVPTAGPAKPAGSSAATPSRVSGRRVSMAPGGGGREEDLPPVIAHADVDGSLVVTAEPIDAVLDDACHDPVTHALKPLEEWPVEFRETCIRRDSSGGEFISQLGFVLRRPPAPNSRADAQMRVAASLFDVTAPLHRLDLLFRPALLSLTHLAGVDQRGVDKGPARWASLRDRIIYHGLPEFSGRLCYLMGLAVATLGREHRAARAPAWRRLAYEDRQDALRLGALLKLARDFERKAGADWIPAALELQHGRPVLLVDHVGFERERLKLKETGGFWRRVFGETLALKRREHGAGVLKHQPKFKPRPFERKQPVDIFYGQNTGAAIAEILAHQRHVFEKQEARLREVRQRSPGMNADEFAADPLIEIIHDYRVALRRLRSYVRLFELPIGRVPVRKMTAPMQALAEPTAHLRQVDVLIETVLADAQAGAFRHGGEATEGPLLQYLFERRAEVVKTFWQIWERSQTTVMREQIQSLLRPDRWCWVGRFGAAKARRTGDEVDFDPARQGDRGRARRAQQTPIEHFAASALLQCLGEARVLYTAARPDPMHCPFGDLHAVRIALKKLRYGFELFAPLMGDATSVAIEVSKRLQDQLGAINDCEANDHCLMALLEAHPPARGKEAKSAAEPVRAAADLWRTYSHKRIQETRLQLVETWPRLFGRPVVKQLIADWWL